MLRHTPFVVGVGAIVAFVGAELSPHIDGLSALLPSTGSLPTTTILLVVAYLLITPTLLVLLWVIDVVERTAFLRSILDYGFVVVLALLVAASVYLVTVAKHPNQVEPNVIFLSGWLLTLLVGGQLLYDATLRIEHLFVNLHKRENDIVGNEDEYRRFLTDLDEALRANLVTLPVLGPVPLRNVFGVLFALQFAIVWYIGTGPQTFDFGVGLVVNAALDAVMASIVFQFIVLIRFFYRLLNETIAYEGVNLLYQPYHIDMHGGYRDFGRFATRINVIIIFAGFYLVYRLYVVGGQALPTDGVLAFDSSLRSIAWILNFAGPVVAWGLIAAAWAYFSFWTIHRKMVRERHKLLRRFQNESNESTRVPAAGDDVTAYDTGLGPEWNTLRYAPTWPIRINKIASLASANALPLLLPVANLLF